NAVIWARRSGMPLAASTRPRMTDVPALGAGVAARSRGGAGRAVAPGWGALGIAGDCANARARSVNQTITTPPFYFFFVGLFADGSIRAFCRLSSSTAARSPGYQYSR